jgi:hypothetical protein
LAYIDHTTVLDAKGKAVVDETTGIINSPDLLPDITSAPLADAAPSKSEPARLGEFSAIFWS